MNNPKGDLVEIRPGRTVLLEVLGGRAEPEEPGGGGMTTLFYFHGSMATKEQFKALHETMQSNGSSYDRSIMFDAFGCGGSPKPYDEDAYTTEQLVLDALEVFHRYSTESNVIVSHSFGTSLTSKVVRRWQEMQRKDNQGGGGGECSPCITTRSATDRISGHGFTSSASRQQTRTLGTHCPDG